MAKKGLVALVAAVALLGSSNMAYCGPTASNKIEIKINIPALRVLYANEAEDIIGIGFLGGGTDFSESDIDVFMGKSKVPLNDKIREQYYTYLTHPEIAGINWNQNKGWHYYAINPQALEDFNAKLQSSILNNTFKATASETLENGTLYLTIIEKN